MSRQTLSRVARLERARRGTAGRRILVAQDQGEAERLRVQHPEALVVITGVPRATGPATGR
jgi:hypothetical protein